MLTDDSHLLSFLQCCVNVSTSAGEPVEDWHQCNPCISVSSLCNYSTAGQIKCSPHLLASSRIKNVLYKNKKVRSLRLCE